MGRRTGALALLALLAGCGHDPGTAARPRDDGVACLADLPAGDPAAIARQRYANGDIRLLAYHENSEGNYPMLPGADPLLSTRPPPASRLLFVRMPRDGSGPMDPDTDHPLTRCGERKVRWLTSYNAAICHAAADHGLRHCGFRFLADGAVVPDPG